MLEETYISPNSAFVKYPDFESGVVKLQRNCEHLLTRPEHDALWMLKLNVDEDYDIQQYADEKERFIEERLKRRRRFSQQRNKYMDAKFILGSVAEVERLWSVSKYVFTENRPSMSQQVFEALVFLKMNEAY